MANTKTITTPETTTVTKNKQVNVDGQMIVNMNATLNENGNISINSYIDNKELYKENSTEVKKAMHTFVDEALAMTGEATPLLTTEEDVK